MACYIPRWYTRPKTVTHPGTNRARRGLTSFMRRTPLTTTPRRQLVTLVSPAKNGRTDRNANWSEDSDGSKFLHEKGHFWGRVTLGFPCTLSTGILIGRLLQQYHHHHRQVRVACECRRVVAPPCPRSTARLQSSPKYTCVEMASRKIQTCQNKAKNLSTIYFVFDLDGECKFIKTKHCSD